MPQTIDNLLATWANSGTTFTAFKFNVVDNASASGSLLMDLQVGGSSRFKVDKTGAITSTLASGTNAFSTNGRINADNGVIGGYDGALNGNLLLGSAVGIRWASSTSWAGTIDLFLGRRDTASLRLGAADSATPVPQTLGVQWASGTNIAGADFTIAGSRSTGSAAGGSIIFQVAPAGTAGSAQNALATALTINSARNLVFPDGTIITNAQPSAINQIGMWAGGVLGLNRGGGSVSSFVAYADAKLGASLSGGSSAGTAPQLGFADPTVGTVDTIITRDAANTLALRNGANAQRFRVYDTYTDASNGVWSEFEMAGLDGRLGINVTGNGSGVSVTKRLVFQTDGVTRFDYGNTQTTSFTFHVPVLFNADNAQDIGASGASRPRSIYVGTNGVFGGTVTAGLYFQTAAAALNGNGGVYFGSAAANRAELQATGVGILTIGRWGTGDVTLGFGGTTSSFPALKRSSTTLQARLADDSAFAPVQGKLTTDTAYTAGAPTATGYLVLYDSTGTAYRVPAVLN